MTGINVSNNINKLEQGASPADNGIIMGKDINKTEGYIFDGMNELERNIKRIADFFIAILSLIVFSPLFLICYIAVKREDKGPAIYSQERIGRFGKPFYIYKFRSMRTDAEKDGPALYQQGEARLTRVFPAPRRLTSMSIMMLPF